MAFGAKIACAKLPMDTVVTKRTELCPITRGGQMDLSNPIHSVIPSLQGDVLAAVARSGQSLSGRGVAELVGERASGSGVKAALRSLVASGLVTAEPHPPVILYRRNRRHVAAEGIELLANLGGQLLEIIRGHIAAWSVPTPGAYLFGSAAPGEGNIESDIDVLVMQPVGLDPDDPTWLGPLHEFASDVTAWTGNDCRVAELSEGEVAEFLVAPIVQPRIYVPMRSASPVGVWRSWRQSCGDRLNRGP